MSRPARVTDCLDACEHSNVMILSPTAAGRQAGGRPVWLVMGTSS